ncbi:MAG: RNA 2',3'-cyclic phosphodiesterase [Sphingomonas fennica]
MHRLFVALHLPATLRQHLLAGMGGGVGLRWQSDAQLHLTLRFIGEVDRHQAEDIAVALGRVRAMPFEIALTGAGTFGGGGRPHSLWVGVTPAAPVAELHARVDAALARAGVPRDGRAFQPHVTVARMRRTATGIGEALDRWAGFATAPAAITDFRLYESHLGGEGATYETIARYALG